ncbi:MAG TPA: hypothetical protein VN915_04265 [Elusimicrobiota bacterium]|nr:hypothetical protein [Elusimicrobiota bacterium]
MSDDLESRLAATDFSADSRVRTSLRAKLLGRRAAPRGSARATSLSLALAAAALLVLVFPRAKPRPAAPVAVAVAPSPARPAAPPRERTRAPRFPRGGQGLPVLPGVLAETAGAAAESPLSSRPLDRLVDLRPVDRVIDVRPGVVVREKDAVAVVWKMNGATYRLETRRVTLQDIFETRRL